MGNYTREEILQDVYKRQNSWREWQGDFLCARHVSMEIILWMWRRNLIRRLTVAADLVIFLQKVQKKSIYVKITYLQKVKNKI